jgi:hypothetical protein
MPASVSVSAAKFEREEGKRIATGLASSKQGLFRIAANHRATFLGLNKTWRGSGAGAGFAMASRLRYVLLRMTDNGFCLV